MIMLKNNKVSLDVALQSGEVSLKDRQGHGLWRSGDFPFIVNYFDKALERESYSPVISGFGWKLSVSPNGDSAKYCLENPKVQIKIVVEVRLRDNGIEVCIPQSGIEEADPRYILSKIHVFPCFGALDVGADGYLVLPNDGGLKLKPQICKPNLKTEPLPIVGLPESQLGGLFDDLGNSSLIFSNKVYSEQASIEELPNMPLYGAINKQSGYSAIITQGEYDAEIVFVRQSNGAHSLHTAFTICSSVGVAPDEIDRSVRFELLNEADADYSGIAKTYRKYLLEEKKVKTLAQRMKDNPSLEKLSRSFINKVLMGLKSFPGYPEGSPYHSPRTDGGGELNVFLAFDDVAKLTKKLAELGVENAYLNITGFNTQGHDGCFPTLFPVEEAFGGEEGLRRLVLVARDCGYLIDAHINYRDGYEISDDWSEANLMLDECGQPRGGVYGPGGFCYEMCPSTAMDLLKRDLPKLRQFDFTGPVYFDNVMGFLQSCHHEEHPLNRREYAEAIYAYLDYARGCESLVATEMTISDMIGRVDLTMMLPFTRGRADLYKPASTLRKMNVCWEGIPLAQIVYHGLMLYTMSFCADEIVEDYLLYFVEAGALPRFDWRDNNPSEHLEENARAYQACCKMLGHLQKELITGHQKLGEGVYQTEYENGQKVIVNYSDENYEISEQIIGSKSFVLL